MKTLLRQREADPDVKLPSARVVPDMVALSSNGPEPEDSLPLYLYWGYVRRYLWQIVTLIMVVTTAATIYALSRPKLYDAMAMVRISPFGTHVTDANETTPASAISPTTLIGTASEMVISPAVVLKTIDDLHLDNEPTLLTAKDRASLSPQKQRELLLREVTESINVERPPMTLLMEIHFRARRPDLAARIANGLAQSFLTVEYQSRVQEIRASSQYMSAQLDDLRAAMERAQRALVNYETTHNVINPDDKTNIFQSRLAFLNTEVAQAQGARMQAEAEYHVLASGGLPAVLSAKLSETLQPLVARLRQDKLRLADMSAVYGPNYFLYTQQQDRVRNDEELLAKQVQGVVEQVQSRYQQALRNEHLVQQEMDRQKAVLDDFNLRAIRYTELKADADSTSTLYYDLLRKLKESNVGAEFRSDDIRVVNPALPNPIPSYPNVRLISLLALLCSTALGIGGAILVGTLDRSVVDPEQLAQWLHLPVLASVPLAAGAALTLRRSPVLTAGAPAEETAGLLPTLEKSATQSSVFGEAVLSLRSALLFGAPENMTVLAVSSSVPGEGKSTLAAHLSIAFADMGNRTVLVDADMRRPNVHRLFGVTNRAGLASVLRGRCPLDEALVSVAGRPNLWILPAGTATGDTTELLLLGLADVLDGLRSRFSLVLIDCPPVLGFADSPAVANAADATLMVVHAGKTDRNVLKAAVAALRHARAQIVGIALNQVDHKLSNYYGYYRNYAKSGYYAATPDDAND